jgi:hypothetical protein
MLCGYVLAVVPFGFAELMGEKVLGDGCAVVQHSSQQDWCLMGRGSTCLPSVGQVKLVMRHACYLFGMPELVCRLWPACVLSGTSLLVGSQQGVEHRTGHLACILCAHAMLTRKPPCHLPRPSETLSFEAQVSHQPHR